MKTTEFKKIIKSVVKEAIREELREVLLEALKSSVKQPIKEQQNLISIPHQNIPNTTSNLSYEEKRDLYAKAMESTVEDIIGSHNYKEFEIKGPIDMINGALPEGNVSVDQIFGLLNKNK
jgi:hypothetical protein